MIGALTDQNRIKKMTTHSELSQSDVAFVVRRLPKDVREILSEHKGKIFLGGGFVRAVIAGEEPSDIDLFGPSKEYLDAVANELVARRGENTRLHKTKNAITVISLGRLTVQFITRWVFETPYDCARSFDFTICQGVVWCGVAPMTEDQPMFMGICHPAFYMDLAARRLVYTTPDREEEAGGSTMRVLKFIRRGYNIQVESLAAVIARMVVKFDTAKGDINDPATVARFLHARLQEVDPLLIIDGLDVIGDEGEEEPEETE